MPKKEYPLEYLQNYLPAAAAAPVLDLLNLYKVHLTVTRERKSILGDYRHAVDTQAHRISVNGNLNKYSFLITLIHELAHLVCFMKNGNRVAAHGREWKDIYRQLLQEFLPLKLFPADIDAHLRSALHNLPASSCADEDLMRILRRYDEKQPGMVLVEELPEGALFRIDGGKLFARGPLVRKRYKCVEVKTRKVYLFSAVYEVEKA